MANRRRPMRRLAIVSMISLIAFAGTMATQPSADDAHHPEKAANSKKPAKANQKKPATKTNKSKQGEVQPGLDVRRS
jgi:hypothetical protein